MTGRRAGGARPWRGPRLSFVLALSAALLFAAILGVQLGQSAISEINPIHFRGVEARPRGIDPAAARPAPDALASAYGWGEGNAARAAECAGDCDARRARAAMASALDEAVRPRPASGPYWRDATPATEPKPWPPGETGETGERPLSVERYMHYPVEEGEESEAKAPPDEDQFAPEE